MYVDESERGNTYAVSGVIIPTDRVEYVRDEFVRLRRTIMDCLTQDDSEVVNHPKLLKSGSPDIHAEWIESGKYYYRVSEQKDYRPRNRKILETVYNFILQNNILCLSQTFPDKTVFTRERQIPYMSQVLEKADYWKDDLKFIESLKQLEQSYYINSLPIFLLRLSEYLQRHGLMASVVCDDDEGR